MRFSLVILLFLATAFGRDLDEGTRAPDSNIETPNDQATTAPLLDEESEIKDILNPETAVPGQDEESNVFGESEGAGEDVDETSEQQNAVDEAEGTRPIDASGSPNEEGGDAAAPSVSNEEEGQEVDESSEGLSLGGDPSEQKPGTEDVAEKATDSPIDQEEAPEQEKVTGSPLPEENEEPISPGTENPAPVAAPVAAPTFNAPVAAPTFDAPVARPSLRPVTPYVATDDDPLKDVDDFNDGGTMGWGWNDSTIDEMEHDRTVIIALSVVFGVMFFFAIFVAYSMLENPDGCCASVCRITVACLCGILRCICYPCRAMCGCTGQSGAQHMMVPDDGHFTHDLELS